MSIQALWLTYFIEILLVLEFQLTKTYFCTFSYKAHFRPQISSNGAPTKTMVVHHRPLRVYNERHLNIIDYTSQPWPLTITIPLRFWRSSLSSSFVRFEEPNDPWLSLPRFFFLLHHSSSNDTCLLQRLVLEPSHWQGLRNHFLTRWEL